MEIFFHVLKLIKYVNFMRAHHFYARTKFYARAPNFMRAREIGCARIKFGTRA